MKIELIKGYRICISRSERRALISADKRDLASGHALVSNLPGREVFLDESQLSFQHEFLKEERQVRLVRVIFLSKNADNAFKKETCCVL